MAGDDRLVIFISSSMDELKPERKAIRSAIKAQEGFEPFAWESDAAAHSHSAQQEWTKQLERSDVTIVVLWKKLGQWTKDEIDISRDRGIPILLYRKRDEEQTLERTEAGYLVGLEDPETGIAAKYFKTPKKLKKYVDQGLWALIKDRFSAARERDLANKDEVRGNRRQAAPTDAGLEVDEAAGPSIHRRDPEDVSRLPPNRWAFVGRTAEKEKLIRAIGTGDQLVAVVGPPGIGKKALLKDVTYHEDLGPSFKDGAGVNPGRIDEWNLEDLLQAIWEEFYEADDLSLVEPRKRRRQLAGIEALVFLPDIELSPDDLDRLLDEMPRTVLCVSEPALASPGRAVALEGFSDSDEMLALFESRYRAEVPQPARSDIAGLCGKLDGNPSLIGLLADRAWGDAEDIPGEEEHPLTSWAASLAPKTSDELRDWLVPPEQRRAVAVAAAAGAHTPHQVMVDMAESSEAVDDALGDNLLEAASPRYRVNAALAAETPADDALMGQIFESALVWARDADADEIYSDRAFVLGMMEWGVEHERWADVLELGSAVEAPMALGGRHGAWEQVLEHHLTAARSVDPVDGAAEAWALHQLGSRALLRDEVGDARVLLHESLRHRSADDDRARAVTRHNLGLIPAAIVSLGVLLLWLVFLATWGVAVVAGPWPFDARLDVAFPEAVPAPSQERVDQPTAPLQAIAEEGAVFTVAIADQTVDGHPLRPEDPGFCIVADGSCVPAEATVLDAGSAEANSMGSSAAPGLPLALAEDDRDPPCRLDASADGRLTATIPGDRGCVIVVGFQPAAPGVHQAELVLVAEADGATFTGALHAESVMPIAEIDQDIEVFDAPDETKPFLLENVGSEAFTVAVIDGVPRGFTLAGDDCSRVTLQPGDSCEVSISFDGAPEIGLLELDLSRASGGEVPGDHTVVLVGGATEAG